MQFDFVSRHLATALTRVAAAVRLAEDGAPAGLERTIAQHQVLLLLSRRATAYRLDELAAELGMIPEAALAAIATLVREGLVTTAPAPSYAPHEVEVVLTDRGRARPPELLNWAADLLGTTSDLTPDEQHRLLAMATRHIRVMQAQGEIPVTKMCVTCRYFEGYAHPGEERPHHCWLAEAPFGHRELRLRCPEQEPSEHRPD